MSLTTTIWKRLLVAGIFCWTIREGFDENNVECHLIGATWFYILVWCIFFATKESQNVVPVWLLKLHCYLRGRQNKVIEYNCKKLEKNCEYDVQYLLLNSLNFQTKDLRSRHGSPQQASRYLAITAACWLPPMLKERDTRRKLLFWASMWWFPYRWSATILPCTLDSSSTGQSAWPVSITRVANLCEPYWIFGKLTVTDTTATSLLILLTMYVQLTGYTYRRNIDVFY